MKTLRPIRRVMLINPPVFDIRYVETPITPPLGIAYLAGFIRDMVEVKLLDAIAEGRERMAPVTEKMQLVGLSYGEICRRVREFKPDMVGLSCVFSSQFAAIAAISKKIKEEVDPEIVQVSGGTHPSFLPEQSLRQSALDYIVLHEGEATLRNLIEAHNRGGGIEELDGFAWREGDEIKINPKTHFIQDLDSMPLPARDLLPMEEYFKACVPMSLHFRKVRNTPIITSRGCPCACTFCSSTIHWGKRHRARSPEKVLAEIELLRDKFGIEELKFQDDNLTLPRERAKAIFQGMADRGLAMPWNTPNGVAVWTLDDELVGLMKKSGCYEFTLAVESGDQDVLNKIIRKPLKLEKVREVRALAKKHGITAIAYFMIGLPGETRENIGNTVKFARELKLEYFIHFIYNPLPGSELWELCVREGYIPPDFHYENANNYFRSVLAKQEFDMDELNQIQSREYFLNNILKLPFRNPREFWNYYSTVGWHRPSFLRTFFLHAYAHFVSGKEGHYSLPVNRE